MNNISRKNKCCIFFLRVELTECDEDGNVVGMDDDGLEIHLTMNRDYLDKKDNDAPVGARFHDDYKNTVNSMF